MEEIKKKKEEVIENEIINYDIAEVKFTLEDETENAGDDGLTFVFKAPTSKDDKKWLSMSERKGWRKKKGGNGVFNNYDMDNYLRLKILGVVMDIKGLTNDDLINILDYEDHSDEWNFFGSKKGSEAVPFGDEIMRFLSQYPSTGFKAFMDVSLEQINEAKKKRKLEELKN